MHPAEPVIRYAAFDLDGTVLDAGGRPREGIVEAVTRLRALGIEPMLVSGRSAASFRQVVRDRRFGGIWDAEALLSDGNVRYSLDTGEVTCLRTLPVDVLAHLADRPGLDLVVEQHGAHVASSRRAAIQYVMAYRMPPATVPVGGWPGIDLGAVTAVTVFRRVEVVRGWLRGLACQAVAIRPFDATVVRPTRTCKARALRRHLRNRFDVGLDRVIAFGDGVNDAAMLGRCAIGVAVRGSHPAALARCSHRLDQELVPFLTALCPRRLARMRRADPPPNSPAHLPGSHPDMVTELTVS